MDTTQKKYIIVAGPNGSGKSTLIKNLQKKVNATYICADEIEKKIKNTNLTLEEKITKARDIALQYRDALINKGDSIIFETVLSHPSHLDILKQIKDKGYEIVLFYVTTSSPNINIKRVNKRKRENDIYLTPERITGRYNRSLELLFDLLTISNEAFIYDNSQQSKPMCYKIDSLIYILNSNEWVKQYITDKLIEEDIKFIKIKSVAEEEAVFKEMYYYIIDSYND